MIESLKELSYEFNKLNSKLYLLYGDNNKVIYELIDKLNIQSLYYNRDYTPYALLRDHKIKELCNNNNINCSEFQDYYLYEPGTILTGSNTYYKKFTPFNRQFNIDEF